MDDHTAAYYAQKILKSDRSISFVKQLENEIKNIGKSHIIVEYLLGIILWDNELHAEAINKMEKIISDEIDNNFCNYNTQTADSVALCSEFLISNCYQNNFKESEYYDLFIMSFKYFSNHLENFGTQMHNSLFGRALLCDRNRTHIITLSMSKLNSFKIPFPILIADYYQAGIELGLEGDDYDRRYCFEKAFNLYDFINDLIIDSKMGCEYSIDEICEIGEKRI